MSGGVDSFYSAYILKERGYRVRGLTYILSSEGEEKMAEIVKKQASFLDIEHEFIDLREDFKRVIDYFRDEYLKGRTPNPCSFCNKWIKFGIVLDKIEGKIATGHYARIVEVDGELYVAKARYKRKSQEYFLSLITEDRLRRIIFPLGELSKEEIKEEVKNMGVEVREESQDICFVKGDYRKYIPFKKRGKILDLRGKFLGYHEGYTNFTVGQRKGSHLSKGVRLYVRSIIPEENTIIVGTRKEVMVKSMKVRLINWRWGDGFFEFMVSVRYRHRAVKAGIAVESDTAYVLFENPQFGPAPGQIATFYKDDLVMGGGVIEELRFLQKNF